MSFLPASPLALVCLLCCLCAVWLCMPVQASARMVRVGYDPIYGNIERTSAGLPGGYGFEYLMQVAQYSDWQYDFIQCDWSQCLRMLEEGTLDILPSMQRTAVRERIFDFGHAPQGFEYASLLAPVERDDLYYDDVGGYRGRRVGLVRRNAINDDFETYANDHQLQVERVFFETTEELQQALQRGEVDMVVGSSTLKVGGLKVLARLGVRAFYVGVNRKARGVLAALDQAQRQMQEQDVYFTARLHEKYFLLSPNRTGLSRQEAEFMRSSPPIRVAINPDWWPVEGFNDFTGQPQGIVIDVLEQLSRRMGVLLRYVRTESYEESLLLMRRGEVEVVTGLAGAMESQLPGLVNASLPLFHVPLVLVGKSGGPASADSAPVAVAQQYQGVGQLRDATLLDRTRFYTNIDAATAALQKDEVPLVLMSSWRFDSLQREPGFSHLRVVNLVPGETGLVLGVSTHVSPQLLSLINKSLLSLDRNEVRTAIFSHTVGSETATNWLLFWRAYGAWLTPVLLLLVLVGVSLALYNKERATRVLHRMALTDELTGIGNHKAFVQLGRRLRKRGDYVLVSMDINNFKNFNAYYGHQSGNVVLQQMAQLLLSFVNEEELACRSGGDTFLMLLRWGGSMEAMRERLQALQNRMTELDTTLSQQRLKLTLSFGLYRLPPPGTPLEVGADCASMARKAGKESYKTTFGVYDEEMDRKVTEERIFEQEMLGAQARGEFSVRLQPKCDLHTGEVVGAEALVRWDHPTRGVIMPGAFVNLFERNGFIAKLDMFVLDFVCRLLRRWTEEGRKPVPISVNMSRLHVLDYTFVDSVKSVIALHSVRPELIELEVTESAFLENTDVLLEIMRELSNFGVHLSMDDFGTGYSSLNMLKSIPVSVLKLDKAFLASTDIVRSRDIIRHVVNMAKDLHMEVVCEGIETLEQVEFLRTTSCRVGQGFYFARPMSSAAFEEMLFGGGTPQRVSLHEATAH